MLQFLREKIVEHMYHFELDLPTLLHSKIKTINLNNFVKKLVKKRKEYLLIFWPFVLIKNKQNDLTGIKIKYKHC